MAFFNHERIPRHANGGTAGERRVSEETGEPIKIESTSLYGYGAV